MTWQIDATEILSSHKTFSGFEIAQRRRQPQLLNLEGHGGALDSSMPQPRDGGAQIRQRFARMIKYGRIGGLQQACRQARLSADDLYCWGQPGVGIRQRLAYADDDIGETRQIDGAAGYLSRQGAQEL